MKNCSLPRFGKTAGGALLAALALLAAAPVAPAQTAAPAKTDEPVKLESFAVTGSRIRRVDSEGPQPIVEFTRQDIETTGYTTVAEMIRNLPFNTGGTIDPQRTQTFASGATTLNLRGLGSQNTLVLINGRRVAPYGLPGNNGFNAVFNLNSLPTAAVEGIEILKDGASAIYGSDAVTGVVNVKLRREYNGLTTSLQLGNTTDKDAFDKQFSLVAGANTGKTNLMVVADYSQKNRIKLADRSVSATADLRRYGGVDGRSSAAPVGRVTVACFGTVTYAAPTATPTIAAAVPFVFGTHAYNFNDTVDLSPATEAYGFFFRMRHEISDRLYAFAEMSWHRNKTNIVNAATPVFGQNEHGDSAAGQIRFPATNPFNPFGVNIDGSRVAFRTQEVGGRTVDLTSDSPRLLVGFGGKLARDWSWESAAMHAESNATQSNTNQVFDNKLQQALNGIRGPRTGRLLFYNPFGVNDPEVVDFIRSNYNRADNQRVRLYDASVTGSLLELPAGPLGLAFGVESRDEKLEQTRSNDEQTGNVVGGSEGFNTVGDRKVQSAYAELRVPVVKGVELQAAARFENYSDFGNTTKPKAGFSAKVLPYLLVRGSFSKSFKAPDLPQLFNGGTVSFSSGQAVDPRRPLDPPAQVKIVTVGNPGLQPETTDTYFGGLVFEPQKNGFLSPLHGLTVSVDYFRFKGTNVIASLNSLFGVNGILARELTAPIFALVVVRADPTPADVAAGLPGAFLNLNDTFLNVSDQEYQGWDFAARYDWKTATWGRFTANATLTYVTSLQFGGAETVNTQATPRFRGTASLNWSRQDWSASLFVNYIHHTDDGFLARTALGGNNLNNNNAQWASYNPQISYRGFRGYTLTAGATNVLDTPAPRSYTASTGYDNLIYDGVGRRVFLKLSKDF
ncbi:MAG: TonB-dependent receptor [Opitutae bacterium]|nr:TonB-dependent receptor [Opitutae bacterium]